jgi:lactam utilization protein B
LTILAHKNLSKRLSRSKKKKKKNQRRKKMYFRGALDSAYFYRMRKVTIYQIDAAGKLCRYQTKTLSYIKAKGVMHQELRHQVKYIRYLKS